MSIQLAKVWHDLWSNKSRTLQVVMVIALGSIAIGLVIGGRNLISTAIEAQWNAAGAPFIKLAVNPALDDDQLRQLDKIEGVWQAEGQLNAAIEYRLAGTSEWKSAQLQSRMDFQAQEMEIIKQTSGALPERGTLGVIKSADSLYGVGEGQTIEVKIGDQVRRYPLSGTLKPIGPFPVVFLGSPVFYADRVTFERITGRNAFDTVVLRDQIWNRQAVEATDLRVQDYFEKIGVDSVGVSFPFQNRIISPNTPPGVDILNAIFLILGVIGAIIIVLGVFLVYNSISAIMTQQVGQIGIMKAIGARSRQVFAGYTILVLSYGVLAMLIALPIGALSAYGLQNLFINLLNMDNPGLQLDPIAGMVQAAVCLLVPLAAAVFPLSAGIRLTVREAISTYGLTGSAGLVDKLAAGLRRIPYSLVMIIGSAFRNRRRVLFIEITLVLAGVIFMMVRGVSDSIQYTFDDKLLRTHGYQASLNFDQVQREQQLAGTALADPRVQVAEVWLVQPGKARPASQKDSQVTDARLQIFGLPADTEMYRADLRMGRWLLSGDQQAVVITQRLADSKGWSVGDQIILSQGDERVDPYRVVGIVFDPLLSSGAFVPLRTLQQQTGLNGQGNSIWMQTGPKDDGSLRQIVTDLTKVYERKGLKISASPIFRENTITQIVDQFGGGFDIIIQLLGIMALIIAVVGGVGLSGVISLNVLERRREIGVMRSIGASDWRVIGLFVGEGLLLGWISWLVALPLSIPAAKFMATTGLAIALNQPLVYHFTPSGALTWLVIVSLMAIIASALPARGASKISVRESLAYQ